MNPFAHRYGRIWHVKPPDIYSCKKYKAFGEVKRWRTEDRMMACVKQLAVARLGTPIDILKGVWEALHLSAWTMRGKETYRSVQDQTLLPWEVLVHKSKEALVGIQRKVTEEALVGEHLSNAEPRSSVAGSRRRFYIRVGNSFSMIRLALDVARTKLSNTNV